MQLLITVFVVSGYLRRPERAAKEREREKRYSQFLTCVLFATFPLLLFNGLPVIFSATESAIIFQRASRLLELSLSLSLAVYLNLPYSLLMSARAVFLS